ncbi:TPA: hypothetical protein RQK14_004422 [Vibrio vulnificus]|nr:hypothetical protein [Vibrio vulnificus]
MESRIPLPTDNLFKFYALFGLMLVIFSVGAFIYVNQAANTRVATVAVEYALLEVNPARTLDEEARFQFLQRQSIVGDMNDRVLLIGITFLLVVGSIMIFYGFRKWHKVIQPLQDEMTRLSIKKLKNELGEN